MSIEYPAYLKKYLFDWELLSSALEGKSAIDFRNFIHSFQDKDQVHHFLKGYGLDPKSPVSMAELFGVYQESLQFIRRYFLKEGNQDGYDYKIPNSLYMITDISDLFLLAARKENEREEEIRLWAELVLKVMHTILHTDKDLRASYFPVIQTQVFDRFYRYLNRDEENRLFLGKRDNKFNIPLVDFQNKAKKSRDSVIIKLLHKAENVAEELFDRVGVRFVTKNRFDTLRVVRFLIENDVVIPHNIKPSRSINALFEMESVRRSYFSTIYKAVKRKLNEEDFLKLVEESLAESDPDELNLKKNYHSFKGYRAIQFTGRQLVRYQNPFVNEFNRVRQLAKEAPESELTSKILSLDTREIAQEIRFFYPFEVQVLDEESYKINTEGEASHKEYKRLQMLSARDRVFKNLNKYYAQ